MFSPKNSFYKNNKQVPIAVLTDADPLDALPVARKLKAKAINPSYKSLNSKNTGCDKSSDFKVNKFNDLQIGI